MLCLLDEVWNEKILYANTFSSQGHFLALPPIEEEVGAVSVGCVCVYSANEIEKIGIFYSFFLKSVGLFSRIEI